MLEEIRPGDTIELEKFSIKIHDIVIKELLWKWNAYVYFTLSTKPKEICTMRADSFIHNLRELGVIEGK